MSGAPNLMTVQSEINNQGKIIFHGSGLIGTGNKICVGPFGTLEIGALFKITDMCNVGCLNKIFIGTQTWIVQRCQLFDSNYHYVANMNDSTIPTDSAEIYIGRNCWICNTTTVTGGAYLPDFTIVGSNSLVNKNFSEIPERSLIGGVPAKYISTGFLRVDNEELIKKANLYYHQNHNNTIFTFDPSIDPKSIYLP